MHLVVHASCVYVLPQRYLRQHAPFTNSLFQSVTARDISNPSLLCFSLSDLLRPAHSDPLPSVAGDPKRIHLHDSGTHRRKIPRSLHAHPLQVRKAELELGFGELTLGATFLCPRRQKSGFAMWDMAGQ